MSNSKQSNKKGVAGEDLVKINVVHCRGWSFGSKFKALKKDLEQKFPTSRLEITSQKTPTKTGYFEVQVVDGPLLHSKKNGDGHINQTSTAKIIENLAEFLGVEEKEKEDVPEKSSSAKKEVNVAKKASATKSATKKRKSNADVLVVAKANGSSSPVAKRTRRNNK